MNACLLNMRPYLKLPTRKVALLQKSVLFNQFYYLRRAFKLNYINKNK